MFWVLPSILLVVPFLIFGPKLLKYHIRNLRSPLRKIPGPRPQSWLFGNIKEIFERGTTVAWDEWMSTYGKTYRYNSLFSVPILFTTDTGAINYILTHADAFTKTPEAKSALELLGEGLLFAEGQKHRNQRRIMNPAFGMPQIKSFVPIFNQKASELRDIWLSRLDENSANPVELNAFFYLGRVTLDIIGLAGFDYEFNSLHSEQDEFATAFSSLTATISAPTTAFNWTIKPIIMALVPLILKLPLPLPVPRKIRATGKIINRIGNEFIAERKETLFREKAYGVKENPNASGKDLLTLLVEANLQEVDAMSDTDVRAQISTFLLAGHETTSAAMAWTLFGLCHNQGAQRKLRRELFTLATNDPTMDQLKALPYLDMVIRESLRLYAPAFASSRFVVKEAVLPMKDGSSIAVNPGDRITIPIYAMNTDRDIWGEDSFEFKPERWESPPEAASENPGVWSNIMSFLGGTRACIGYQFTLTEMKCLLFTLIRTFEFTLIVPAEDIVWRNQSVIRRPFVKGKEQDGPKLPLYVKAHTPDSFTPR